MLLITRQIIGYENITSNGGAIKKYNHYSMAKMCVGKNDVGK